MLAAAGLLVSVELEVLDALEAVDGAAVVSVEAGAAVVLLLVAGADEADVLLEAGAEADAVLLSVDEVIAEPELAVAG